MHVAIDDLPEVQSVAEVVQERRDRRERVDVDKTRIDDLLARGDALMAQTRSVMEELDLLLEAGRQGALPLEPPASGPGSR